MSQSSFVKISSKHCLSQTKRAIGLTFGEIVHSPPGVTCHMSHVMCPMSPASCHLIIIIYFFVQSGGASWSKVCCQQGLPRLFFLDSESLREGLWESVKTFRVQSVSVCNWNLKSHFSKLFSWRKSASLSEETYNSEIVLEYKLLLRKKGFCNSFSNLIDYLTGF